MRGWYKCNESLLNWVKVWLNGSGMNETHFTYTPLGEPKPWLFGRWTGTQSLGKILDQGQSPARYDEPSEIAEVM